MDPMPKMLELRAGFLVLFGVNQSMAFKFVAILMGWTLLPAYAEVVHKWVGTDGITHYSAEAPSSSMTPVVQINLPASYRITVDVESDYYSIANQWQRLHNERIERDKLKLQLANAKAAQLPASPQVVYVNERQVQQSVAGYPTIRYRRHGHDRFHRRIEHYHSGGSKKGSQRVRLGGAHRRDVRLVGSYKH